MSSTKYINASAIDISFNSDKVQTDYSPTGKIIGYTWPENTSIAMFVSLNTSITIDENSLLYSKSGEHPDSDVGDFSGQKAYNIVDIKSWTLVSKANNKNVWIEDKVLTYPDNGDITVQLIPDVSGKTLEIEFYNFRKESLYKLDYSDTSETTIYVDQELSNLFKQGLYYMIIRQKSGSYTKTLKDLQIHIVDYAILPDDPFIPMHAPIDPNNLYIYDGGQIGPDTIIYDGGIQTKDGRVIWHK